jgi:hypothetical protein
MEMNADLEDGENERDTDMGKTIIGLVYESLVSILGQSPSRIKVFFLGIFIVTSMMMVQPLFVMGMMILVLVTISPKNPQSDWITRNLCGCERAD